MKRGRPDKKYLLDDGSTVTVSDVVEAIGCKRGGARRRLNATNKREEIFAYKGKNQNLKPRPKIIKPKKPRMSQAEVERRRMERHIIKTKPFYNDDKLPLCLKVIGKRYDTI